MDERAIPGEVAASAAGGPVGNRTFEVRGPAGVAAAVTLRGALIEAIHEGQSVRVDLRECEHVDTALLQILLALQRELASRGRSLVLEASPAVRGGLELAGAGCLLP